MEYLSELGLTGMPLEGHLMVIDDVVSDVTPRTKRRLIMDHERLAARAQYHLMPKERDGEGREVLRFAHGGRAYEVRRAEEFLTFLRTEPEHLAELVRFVRDALFERFREDGRSRLAPQRGRIP